jgi:hypothetical protein
MRGRIGAVCRAAMRAGAIVAVLLLTACYDSDTEVIPASLAGTPEAMLGFIRAHSQFSFRDNNP